MPVALRRELVAAFLTFALIASLLGPVPAGASDREVPAGAPFLVGAATTNANPDAPVCLGGYGSFCTRPMTGVKDDLTTAAFAVTGAGGETVIIVKSTAVGLFASYKPEQGATGTYQIRQRIAELTGVPADQVIVTSDHSHSAPDTIGIWGGVNRAYMEKLAGSIVEAAVGAYEARQPATLSVASVDGPPLDSSYARPPTDAAALDEEFRALFAESPDGSPIATLVNYAPHATVCGQCGDQASGDWTAWAAQEIAARNMGVGIGFVGAMGSTDWRKSGNQDEREAEARTRINTLLDAALQAREPVAGDRVAADVVFIREKLMQPVLAANYVPAGVANFGEGDVRIDRDTRAPWLTGSVLGTYVGAVRIGDVFMSTVPGEAMPQVQDALRDTITGASHYFMLGAANDFLGYMVSSDEEYRQTLEEGATFLPGCPEQEALDAAGVPNDGACPDHWTLMVSPTIGRHAICTIQDASERLGFGVNSRSERCAALTALDGQQAPPENPGGHGEPPTEDVARAGVASVDASWHIGASGGQFSDEGPPFSEDAVDPHLQSTKKVSSYGLGSRSSVRALVVEGSDGEKIAIVSHDLYLAQDLLTRRIATLVARATGIPADNVMVTASHNHNSPYYSTPGWGTWLFQDAMDLRFYEYMAERAAAAVKKADDGLVPVRVGGSTSTFNEITSHTYGPQIADDGTPAGQPYDHTTGELTVVAFDDMSDPSAPAPLATWVVFGVHPEWTWGYDLLNSDIAGATTRIVDREVGGITLWSGREMGTSGPHKDTRVQEPQERREYQDNGFAQLDRAARLLATAVADTRADVAAGTPEIPDRFAPFEEGFDVGASSQRFAPPSTRPYPGVSNCNTASLFHGDPRVPVLGLPDCSHVNDPPSETGPVGDAIGQAWEPVGDAIGPMGGQMYEELKKAGVPIPESYSATALTGVEETAAVHLMAIKLGDIGITVCPCEQFTDTALNIESRIDRVEDNLWLGFNWTKEKTPSGRDFCVRNADGTWTCANPKNPNEDLAPVSDIAYRRMIAQIENDAAGWEIDDGEDVEGDVRTLGSEAEPYEPAEIKGNFTQEEFPDAGFKLPIAVGMGNDYWGYVPEYREYRAFDYYRKALSALGPHGADFLATRLSRMAVEMNGGPGVALRPIDLAYQAESARAQAVADGLGEMADAYERAYAAQLPADGGEPRVLSGPDRVELFSAAHLRWVGGSTYADMPEARVERLVEGDWRAYGDIDGDIQLTVKMPRPEELPDWRAGRFTWEWTAAFEAFGSDIALPDASGDTRTSPPFGTYRFVVTGQRRTGPAQMSDYRVAKEFELVPWDGITATDLRLEADGVSFTVGSTATACPGKTGQAELGRPGPIDLPDSYSSPFRYIECEWRLFKYDRPESEWQSYCSFCTFRPWADTSEVASAMVRVTRLDGTVERIPATERDGRLHAPVVLYEGDIATIERGGVVDEFGDINGQSSNEVAGTEPRPTDPTEPPTPEVTQIASTGPSGAQYSDEGRFEATLTDANGDPVADAEVTFELTGVGSSATFDATTNENGVASVTRIFTEKPGAYQLIARFAGNDAYLGSADVTPFVVDREDTTIAVSTTGNGKNLEVRGRLSDADSEASGIEGRELDFYADGVLAGSATTGPEGVATFRPPSRYRGAKKWEARFEGDDHYKPS